MKLYKHKIVSVLFLSIFLSSLAFGISASLFNSLPNLAHFSKTKEIKSNSKDEFNNESFVLEENENENETESSLISAALLLPFFVSHLSLENEIQCISFSNPIKGITHTPIFIAVRNFRI